VLRAGYCACDGQLQLNVHFTPVVP